MAQFMGDHIVDTVDRRFDQQAIQDEPRTKMKPRIIFTLGYFRI